MLRKFFLIAALSGAGCQSPTADKTTEVLDKETPTPISEDSTKRVPALQVIYAKALQLAVQGDPTTLLLCDSLLTNPGPGAGAEPYYYKGIYYGTTGDLSKAISFFDKTIRSDYSFYEAYIEKASLLIEAKQFEAALKELELLRTLSPRYAPVHYWLGKWAELQGKKQMATEHYQLALSLDSSITEAQEALKRLKK
ncbi:MAG: tetratricopeptide repeat protein [Sphingomonadales bacterium]